MASNASKLICLVLFFAFINQGYGETSLNDLVVRQSKTGKMVKNNPEWEVRVTNTLPDQCKFQHVKLLCAGFFAVTKPVPASALAQDDYSCLLNGGNFIYPHVDIVFKYVRYTTFDFRVLEGAIVCS